jgi:hypothetical protein
VFKGANPDLLAIMNAGADGMLAKVMRSEKTEDGRFLPREFSCFAPVAFTSIKQVPKTLQSRSIVLRMQRAAKDEQLEQLTVRTRGALIDIGRKFIRWAADLGELPDPNLPQDLFNRIEDRWFVMFQIAGLASGEWPERCKKAALGDLTRGKSDAANGGPDGDLLQDIWKIFHASKQTKMFTKEICSRLLAVDESPWMTANDGKPVDDWYLRTHLRDFLPNDLEKIAPRKWQENKLEARGFDQRHFEDAFKRYLGKGLPCPLAKRNQTNQSTPRGAPSSKEASKHPPDPSDRRQGEMRLQFQTVADRRMPQIDQSAPRRHPSMRRHPPRGPMAPQTLGIHPSTHPSTRILITINILAPSRQIRRIRRIL